MNTKSKIFSFPVKVRIAGLIIIICFFLLMSITRESVAAEQPGFSDPFTLPTGCCGNQATFMQLLSGDLPQDSEWQDGEWELFKIRYPGMVDSDRLGNATYAYNCHSYIFHGGTYWLNDQTPYFGTEAGCWVEDANGTIRSRTGAECHSCTVDYVGKCGSRFLAKKNHLVYGEINTKYKRVTNIPIPTLSEWKRIFLTLLMMSLVMGFARSRLSGLALSSGGLHVAFGVCLALDKRLYLSALKWTGLVTVSGLAAVMAIFGPVSALDLTGTLCCAPLAAYIIHLVIPWGDTEESISQNR